MDVKNQNLNCDDSAPNGEDLSSQTIQLKLQNLESEDKIHIILNNKLPAVTSE